MFCVYLLRYSDGSYYTAAIPIVWNGGWHKYQAGECEGYAATRLPVERIWSQETTMREEVLSAE